ncbi:hypothetical protein HI914_06671 [Erysiphe necator]|nr:hypothetical protein HI914_06671 [Erysiphe necator]
MFRQDKQPRPKNCRIPEIRERQNVRPGSASLQMRRFEAACESDGLLYQKPHPPTTFRTCHIGLSSRFPKKPSSNPPSAKPRRQALSGLQPERSARQIRLLLHFLNRPCQPDSEDSFRSISHIILRLLLICARSLDQCYWPASARAIVDGISSSVPVLSNQCQPALAV